MTAYLKVTASVFFRYRHLLKNLIMRDFKVRYRRSTLGVLWSILNPLLMTLVMGIIFSHLYYGIMQDKLPIVHGTNQPPHFWVYILTGQLLFNFFGESTTTALDSILCNAALIKKVYIPKYIFPLEKVLFSLVNAGLSMICLLLVIIVTNSRIGFWVVLSPVPLLLLCVFNFGAGLILSAAAVFFRDIKHLYSVLVLMLTYMTPIFYADAMLGTAFAKLLPLNPVYWYVTLFRQLLLYNAAPTFSQWFLPCLYAAVSLFVGLAVFRQTQDDFILYL